MKLIEKMKCFYLKKMNDGGFTLVELIVVIAILAILAGVAVPAYSGYVEKANKQADMQLVSDIEKALELAYYNQDLPEGSAGFIMLSPNEGESMVDEEGDTALALEKTFGTNWLEVIQLKHDAWNVSWNTISYEDATNLVNSNFVQKYTPSELMNQVQAMTEAANGLSLNVGDTTVRLYDTFGYTDAEGSSQNAIIDVMQKYGIGENEADWNSLTAEEKSNVLVLATANSVSSGTNAGAVGYLTEYSRYAAYAAEDAAFNKAYQTFQNAIKNVTPNDADAQYNEIKAAYQNLKTAANNSNFAVWDAENKEITEAAFKAVMDGIGNAMNENEDAILAELSNSNMFTTGIGSELYNDYLNSAYATANNVADFDEVLEALEVGVFPGAVIIQYAVVNGTIYITNSLPIS